MNFKKILKVISATCVAAAMLQNQTELDFSLCLASKGVLSPVFLSTSEITKLHILSIVPQFCSCSTGRLPSDTGLLGCQCLTRLSSNLQVSPVALFLTSKCMRSLRHKPFSGLFFCTVLSRIFSYMNKYLWFVLIEILKVKGNFCSFIKKLEQKGLNKWFYI